MDFKKFKYTNPKDLRHRLNPFRRKNMWQPTFAEKIVRFIGSLLYSLTFPFWLAKIFLDHSWRLIKAFPGFIKGIPSWPKRTWYYILYKFKEIVWEQSFLRRASFFWKLKNFFFFLSLCYIILSILDESIKFFTPTTYFYLKFLTEKSFLTFFSFILIGIILWICSFYFINLYYTLISYKRIFIYLFISYIGIQIPALLFLVFYSICENFEILLSFYFVFYSFLVNEQTEEYSYNEGVFMLKKSWQHDHYLYKMKMSKGAEKMKWKNEVQRWSKWDKHQSIRSAW